MSALALRSARVVRPVVCLRAASTSAGSATPVDPETAAQLNTKRGDYLLNFSSFSKSKTVWHYTSYALAAGFPLAMAFGGPIGTVVDLAFAVVIPVHMHMGMRSVLLDYIHPVGQQKLALALLAAVTLLTGMGLVKLTLTDIGLTGSLRELFVEQVPAAAK